MALGTILKLAAVCTVAGFVTMSLTGCDDKDKDKNKGAAKKEPATETVVIAGRTFHLEPAVDQETRFKGLSGRTEIKADGGMLFVFKEPDEQNFVMRDCPIPIDIIYLDASGRITASHKMTPEPPRADDEKEPQPPRDASGKEYPNMPKWTWTNAKYESRLKKYPSKHPAQYVIELRGNTLDDLKVKDGDKVELDRAELKKRAK